MTRFRIDIFYKGHAEVEVEADDVEEAVDKATTLWRHGPKDAVTIMDEEIENFGDVEELDAT